MTSSERPPAAAAPDPAIARPPRFEPPSVQAAQARQSQRFLLLVVRLLFLVLLVTVTVLTIYSQADTSRPEQFNFTTAASVFVASMLIGLIVLLVDVMSPNKRLTAVVGVYIGVCFGLIGALAIGSLVDVVADAWAIKRSQPGQAATGIEIYLGLAKVIVAIILCYLAVSVVLTTKDDFRLVIPYVEFAKQVRGVRPMVLDTSVLIDGRITTLGETSFLDAPLVVPSFVIDELQTLADSGDKLKRERGRRGLAMLTKLQSSPVVDVSIDETRVEGRSVDHMLLELATQQNMRVLTTDFNLGKVGQIRGVSVLNLNDLAGTLKTQVIPGETIEIEIVKPGEGPSQGVGYLDDGTMVVVEDGIKHLKEVRSVVVTNSLQTSAGRLVFARLAALESEDAAGGSPPQDLRDTGERVESLARSATTQPRTPVRTDAGDPRDAASRRNPRR